MSIKTLFKSLIGLPQDRQTSKSEYYGESAIAELKLPEPVDTEPHGRIIKADKHQQYMPDVKRHGGRVVKAMPRELKRIKAAQEKTSGEEATDNPAPRFSDN